MTIPTHGQTKTLEAIFRVHNFIVTTVYIVLWLRNPTGMTIDDSYYIGNILYWLYYNCYYYIKLG